MDVVSVIVNLVKGSFCVYTCIAFAPFIALAHLNNKLGQIYYWIVLAIVDRIWLRRVDKDLKDRLFKPLRDSFESRRNIKALEVGPGAGTNFSFLPHGLHLTTLEQNPFFKKHFETVNAQHPNIFIDDMLIGDAENMVNIPDESFDVVIGTHIFCCIDDYKAAAREIYRILKPGGQFYFMDIIEYPRERWFRYLCQRFIRPFWYFMSLRCKAGNIDGIGALANAGFDISRMREEERNEGQWAINLHLYGTAIKPL